MDDQLIQKLVIKHTPRRWYKTPLVLFGLWFCFHITYFVGLGLMKFDMLSLGSSSLYIVFVSVGIIVSGAIFIHIGRHLELKVSFFNLWMVALIVWVGAALFIESYVMMTISHVRTFSVTQSDLTCFLHSVASTIGPALLFPIFFKNFFITHPKWAMTFMSIHLSLMGSLLNELKCPDRELWHLLLGHHTIYFGVGALLLISIYFGRKIISANT